ncbi:hypothetical protein ABIE79_007784 [Bradyrhizobium diazoefficiens]
MLNEDKEQAGTLKEGIAEQISTLPLSVSFVKQEEALIRTAQTHHYWAKADENKFDELVGQTRPADEIPRADGWFRPGAPGPYRRAAQQGNG